MNLSDLFAAADEAREDDDLIRPEANAEFVAEIVYSKGEVKDGKPRFINKLKVVDASSPYNGGEFFDNVFFAANDTESRKRFNKGRFTKLSAAGLTASFWANNPSPEAAAAALLGSKVRVKVRWQKQSAEDKAAGKEPWGDHSWAPVSDLPEGFEGGFGV